MESLLVAFDRFIDHASRYFTLFPTDDLHALSLEVLVDMEEVLHFLQIVLRKVRDVEVLVIVWVVTRHREDLVVRLTPVAHSEHAKWTAINLAAGKRRLVDYHERVKRIAVKRQRPR